MAHRGSGPDPDRYLLSNFEAMNFLKLAMQTSGFRGREDTMKLIEALEGTAVKESDDFPQGDKLLRREDHQAFLREFIFDIKGGKHHLVEVVAMEKTLVPPACTFPNA
jgi:branched-chain amino acid transport system substrate-binding protein